jgi:hypothetical protein
MACKKYTLTNNTASTQTFSYQECSNNMWIYDVLLEPGQTKTIWFVTSTFQSYYTNSITIVDDGAFPPTPSASVSTPTPTPTPSVTPTRTVTPTPTITPSVTPSITPSITASVTPTPSITPSITPTTTLTPTPSITPSATPSFNFKVGNTNSGGAYINGITATTGTITTKMGYSYPVDENELLFADYVSLGTTLDFDIEVIDSLSSGYTLNVIINGSTVQTWPGPGSQTVSYSNPGLSSGNTDVFFVELTD